MTKPTTTRAELRRMIMREVGTPFFRRFPSARTGATIDVTRTQITDVAFVQENDYWKEMWFYVVDGANAGAVRLITDFTLSNRTLLLEYPLDATFTTSDSYEIHSRFNAFEVHDAINQAIKVGFPAFFSTVGDDTLVMQEDTLTYDLSSLVVRPHTVHKVWVEQNSTPRLFTAVAGTANSVTAPSGVSLTDVTAAWRVSIYDGTGRGQLRSVVSVAGQVITVSPNWTITPNTTSKMCLWNPTEETSQWYRMMAVRFDAQEYPTRMYFSRTYPKSYGMRIRLQYIAQPPDLTADASTTVIPREYVVDKALATMYASRADDNRADRQRYQMLADQKEQKAELFARKNSYRLDSQTLWLEEDRAEPGNQSSDNPVAW